MKEIELNYYGERDIPVVVFELLINKIKFQFNIYVFSPMNFKDFFDVMFEYLVQKNALTFVEADILLNKANTIQSFIEGLELIRTNKQISFKSEIWRDIKKYSLQNDLIEEQRKKEFNANVKGIKGRLSEA